MIRLITAALLLSVLINAPVSADDYSYKKYRHAPFRHLEFDILNDWRPIQNKLEVVFTDKNENLPQLFFQTIGKTVDFHDSKSFLEFIKSQEPKEELYNIKSISAGGFSGISYEFNEPGVPDLAVHGLIIDVGEGIIWFYLKVLSENNASPHPIIKQLIATLDFK